MKRLFVLSFTVFLLCVLLVPGLAGAEDQWQTVTLGPVVFQLPANWQQLEEDLGLSELEMAWFEGEFLSPSHYLILAVGEDLATLVEMFIQDDDSVDIDSDELIPFLDTEARKLVAFNQATSEYGVFFGAADLSEPGEELFMMVGGTLDLYEVSLPLTEEIIASFTLAD